MTVEKEIKKITLFPNDVHPLSEDALINYVSPMGELGFLPAVNKGVTIRYNSESDKIDKIDAWTVNFSHAENYFKVSVDVDRVVIETELEIDWATMLDKAHPIVEIVVQNNPGGLCRIAAGTTVIGSATIEELRDRIHLSDEELNDESAREKTERFVRVSSLKNEQGEELLSYNDVHTFKVIWQKEGLSFIDDYDINTSVDNSSETVTSSIGEFFKEAASLLSNKSVTCKTTEGV